MWSKFVPLNTIALELVPPNLERGVQYPVDEARKVLALATETGIEGRIRHVMIPGMIDEDDDRPARLQRRAFNARSPRNYRPSSGSMPTVTPGRDDTDRRPRRTPGMNEVRSSESCRIDSVSPSVPNNTS